ncbi:MULTISPECIES: T9SS-dependent choice-of-anchor J family protein [unclassified Lentimicrobium]|uniref:T9SS-dependent choice-of-anchor J family protein n=1 Tax=unclassified Lentimicrobium TaxID=2677434 RepID=UPI001552DF7F|nr:MULTISPECIES: choice-of-anchor J domain-containing protein [unclassified Lentimicrobium]NPD44028.1 T9SS type A sorting domain-containing protein [Lentimicrobium sp. S6]NPD84058.1 T9SS type A sorting domain-containing protein [Lentimicrobium sp. L6]
MKNNLAILLLMLAQLTFAQDITTFPYTTSFEEIEQGGVEEYPEGWTSEDLNINPFTNQAWRSIKNSSTSENAHTGETAIHMLSHFSETNNDWLYTPSIEMEAGEVYTLKFWYTAKILQGSIEKIKVHIAGENNALAMLENTELWIDDNVDEDLWKQAEINYIAAETGMFYFGFHYFSDELSFVFIIDDVEIDGPTISGIQTQEELKFQVLGNPAQSEIKIAVQAKQNIVAHLYSIDGSLIRTQKIAKGSTELHMNISDIPQGTYFLNILGNKRSKVEKIIISR